MHRTTAENSVGGRFADEDLGTGFPGTEIAAVDMNSLQEELANAVLGGGLALDPGNDGQLAAVLAADRAAVAAAVAALSDGKAGITWGTNWSDNLGGTRLLKMANGLVVLVGNANLSSGAATTILTLPVGFRPSGLVAGSAVNVNSSTAAVFEISTTGAVFLTAAPSVAVYAFSAVFSTT